MFITLELPGSPGSPLQSPQLWVAQVSSGLNSQVKAPKPRHMHLRRVPEENQSHLNLERDDQNFTNNARNNIQTKDVFMEQKGSRVHL